MKIQTVFVHGVRGKADCAGEFHSPDTAKAGLGESDYSGFPVQTSSFS